jgi:hypothetical protein
MNHFNRFVRHIGCLFVFPASAVVYARFMRQIRRLWFRSLPLLLDVDFFVSFSRRFLVLRRAVFPSFVRHPRCFFAFFVPSARPLFLRFVAVPALLHLESPLPSPPMSSPPPVIVVPFFPPCRLFAAPEVLRSMLI